MKTNIRWKILEEGKAFELGMALNVSTSHGYLTNSLQLVTDGILIAFAVTLAAPCSTQMPISFSLEMVPSFATIAHTAAARAATKSKIWPSSPAIKHSAPVASDAAIARRRSKTFAMPGLLKEYSAWIVMSH
jgi:hypothetical protein